MGRGGKSRFCAPLVPGTDREKLKSIVNEECMHITAGPGGFLKNIALPSKYGMRLVVRFSTTKWSKQRNLTLLYLHGGHIEYYISLFHKSHSLAISST